MKKYWKIIMAAVMAACLLAGCNSSKPVSEKTAQGEIEQKQEMKENENVQAFAVQRSKPKEKKVEETFDYVAVGNSLTINEINELWWANWGMAATREENDYVHIISNWLSSQTLMPVTTMTVSIKNWEVASNRTAALDNYTQYFNEDTDLVTLQTGENITEGLETLGTDYPALVKMIKEKAPNAQILMLGTVLWDQKEELERAKQEACGQYGIPYIDVNDFRAEYDNNTFRSKLGQEVYGEDGSLHAIDNEVVAAHPNDAGMANLAQHFIDYITLSK